ncbi:MAG: sialidase family protein, partial [Ignavibacteriaceae bacterium]|nr:sialidase family protein [Ignavibacteriaceae bacterium]
MKKTLFFIPLIIAGFFVFIAQKSADDNVVKDDPRYSIIKTIPGAINTDYSDKPVDFKFSDKPRQFSNNLESITVFPNFRVLPRTNTNQSEVIITRHPTNHDIMWASSNATNIGGSLFISEGNYVTTNGGANWYGSDTLPSTPISGHSGDPGPIIDKDGTFIMTRLGNGLNIWSNWSTNNGISFSSHVPISTSNDDDKNLATTDDDPASPYYGRGYVAWTRFSGSAGWIYISYTTNNGQSWSAPYKINPGISGHFSHGVDLRVGPGGVLYVTYATSQSTSPYTEKYLGFAKSTDGGTTWTVNDQAIPINGIRTTSFGSYGIRTAGFPRIDVDRSGGPRNGWVYLVSPQNSSGNGAGTDAADMILYYSTNGGTNWSAPIRVNQDTPGNGKVQFFNAIRIDEFGGINVLYYDNRNTATDSAEVMLSRSIDGATTWTDYVVSDHRFRPRPISGLAGGYAGDYIGMTSGNSRLWPVWMDNSTGNYQCWTAPVLIANFPLNSFNIQTPSPGVTLTSFPGSTTTVSITWDTSATGASYK